MLNILCQFFSFREIKKKKRILLEPFFYHNITINREHQFFSKERDFDKALALEIEQ